MSGAIACRGRADVVEVQKGAVYNHPQVDDQLSTELEERRQAIEQQHFHPSGVVPFRDGGLGYRSGRVREAYSAFAIVS
jgi:hypothetical protein